MREKKNMLQVILQSKIEQFVLDFLKNSKEMYCDDNGNLIHPGEFGTHREKLCMDLLRNIIPMRLGLGSGFIIDATGNVSHQCDIIIFDSINTPLIENNEKQRFFPIESVVGVGEVKSNLSKAQLKEALQKLSNVKNMRLNIEENRMKIFYRDNNSMRKYKPGINPRDQLFTFLICDSLLFECDGLVNEFNEIYENIDVRFRHNMILSVKDGAFMYYRKDRSLYYPYIKKEIYPNCLIKPYDTSEDNDSASKYAHIFVFLNYIYQGISNGTILYPELKFYIAQGTHKNMVLEERDIK